MPTTLIAKIAARAKVIRGNSKTMTWQTALKKAGAEFRGTTVKTSSKRLVSKKKPIKKTKSKVGDPFEMAYKRSPLAVKKIIDKLGDDPSYSNLKKAAASLKTKGYFMDYGLDGGITVLRPIKKVGEVPKTKKGQPRKRLTKNMREYNADVDSYKYFIVMNDTNFVQTGFEYKEDAKYALTDYDRGAAKIMTLAQMKKAGIKDPRSGYKYEVGSTKKVVAKRPKIVKASVDLDQLNGVIIFQRLKTYEIIKGSQKGSCFKITGIGKAQLSNSKFSEKKIYNVDFYEYRSGVLCKPFKGIITESFLNKQTIRPRQTVKASEYKKYGY